MNRIRPACFDILKKYEHMFCILTRINRVLADRGDPRPPMQKRLANREDKNLLPLLYFKILLI